MKGGSWAAAREGLGAIKRCRGSAAQRLPQAGGLDGSGGSPSNQLLAPLVCCCAAHAPHRAEPACAGRPHSSGQTHRHSSLISQPPVQPQVRQPHHRIATGIGAVPRPAIAAHLRQAAPGAPSQTPDPDPTASGYRPQSPAGAQQPQGQPTAAPAAGSRVSCWRSCRAPPGCSRPPPTAGGKQAMACTIPYRLYRILNSRIKAPLQRLAASQAVRSSGPWKSSRASAITSPGSLTQGGRQRPQDRWLMGSSAQPFIQLEGLLVDQRHLRHGRVQGIEQQVAGLRHHHRGQQ